MICTLRQSKKIIKNSLIPIIFILNLMLIGSIFYYSVLFYIGINIFILSDIIIFISILAFFLKLIYWHLIKKKLNMHIIGEKNQSRSLLRIAFCICTYFTPSYYIFKQETLVMNDDIILITLFIISIIATVGIFIERHLFYNELQYSNI